MKYDTDILRIIGMIGGHISAPANEIPNAKPSLTPKALALIHRKEAELRAAEELDKPIKPTEDWNHKYPQRKVRHIAEATGRMDFYRAERDYHGYEKPLVIATGGHRLRGLDFLIKSRT